jgi:hypothetical protein
MNVKEELAFLKVTIEEVKLREVWRDGPFVKTEEEAEKRCTEKERAAEGAFLQMMRSPKNNGTDSYREWSIRTALGLKTSKHKVSSKVNRR